MTKTGSDKDVMAEKQPENWKAYVNSVKPMFYKHNNPDLDDPLPRIRTEKSGMGFPRVKEFGCGISTRTGAILIGSLYLLGGIMISAPAIICGDSFIEFLRNSTKNSTNLFHLDKYEDLDGHVTIVARGDEDAAAVGQIILDVFMAYGVYQIIVSLLLLLGIQKNIRWCMMPWLITQGIGCTLSIFAFMIVLFLPGLIPGYYSMFPLIGIYSYFGQLISTFISTAVSLYIFCVVHTHYRNLKIPPQGFTPFENF